MIYDAEYTEDVYDAAFVDMSVEDDEMDSAEAGFMHGGAMTALLDEVVGTMVNEEVGRRHATVQFATVFLKPVQLGDFVEVSCRVVEATHSMTFVEAKLAVADAAVATATLIFKARRSAD